jgi:hypothetical protein
MTINKKEEKMMDVEKETSLILPLQFPISAYNFESATIKNRRSVLPVTTFCTNNNQTVDLSGSSGTDVNGQMIWKLSDFMCFPVGTITLHGPASLVATQ